MDHPKPWLRYINASSVSDQTLELDAMNIRNNVGEELGTVDGLVVDSGSGRPRYVVVDAGGWFKSKKFLVPIGQVHLDPARDALLVAITKEQISRFPGFDTDEFDQLTDNDIKRLNDTLEDVFEPGAPDPANEPHTAAWTRESYRVPEWWTENADRRP